MDILIADDDPITRKILSNIIKATGHEVVCAENGMEAWELLRAKKTRILISDWMMPELDGPDLCRKIRGADWPYYVYIILLTSRDQKNDAIKGLEAGADDYMIKPVHHDEIIARIRSGQRIVQLEENYRKMHAQLLQSDKMASIGQLAAGVAHEINNPTGFISSNLVTLNDYQKDLTSVIEQYRELVGEVRGIKRDINPGLQLDKKINQILELEEKIDIDFLLDDVPKLVSESIEGTKRIKQIVLDLKDFAHPGENELKYSDINKNLDSTLNVVWNEIKYKAVVNKDYGELPLIKCYPQQLNQVFMNILVNAAQSIRKDGMIKIATLAENGHVRVTISDTGCGIPAENIPKVFDPFFTTKEVGKGTGLGLNVAYKIIKKHNGSIIVESKVGEGTVFTISVPVNGVDED
jgi:two-component system, NtrC family, sensor kinase